VLLLLLLLWAGRSGWLTSGLRWLYVRQRRRTASAAERSTCRWRGVRGRGVRGGSGDSALRQ
jgi:hypothetical protein